MPYGVEGIAWLWLYQVYCEPKHWWTTHEIGCQETSFGRTAWEYVRWELWQVSKVYFELEFFTLFIAKSNGIVYWYTCTGNSYERHRHQQSAKSELVAYVRVAAVHEPVVEGIWSTIFWTGNMICLTKTLIWHSHMLGNYWVVLRGFIYRSRFHAK